MKVWLAACFLGLIVSCVPSAPGIPEPDAAMAEKSGISIETLAGGRRVYVSQCGRCHELVAPDAVKTSDWKLVVPGMCWNAGLSAADEKAVLNYVLAAKNR